MAYSCRQPWLLWSCFLLIGCSPLERDEVLIIGHGGLGADAAVPMNSEAALTEALALGADGVELDVQLTADGVLVAYHAQDLAELTACQGIIHAHTYAQLAACGVIGGGDERAPIIRLDSALQALAQVYPTATYTLDIKLFAQGDWWNYLEAFAAELRALHTRQGLLGRLIVECQVQEFLDLMRRSDPNMPVFLYATEAEEGIRTASAKGYTGLTIAHDRIASEQVALARSQGLQVALFGVGGWWGHRQALAKRPQRLQTDDPGGFQR